ncbi:hypothetical protein AR688_13010 [Rheinheimera sp. EpRS3]|nr:hypothetical protein AR688_13010 [Rheinheimera sp. EpRS3]
MKNIHIILQKCLNFTPDSSAMQAAPGNLAAHTKLQLIKISKHKFNTLSDISHFHVNMSLNNRIICYSVNSELY